MKTLVLFAHHDVGNRIDAHVTRYVQNLCNLGDVTVVFVSDPYRDKPLDGDSLAQLMPFCNEFYSGHQPAEYFGSWRIAWDIADRRGWIDTAERVVLVNDSVFNVLPLKEMWDSFKGADFYGAIESEESGVTHFEPFFLAFDMNKKTRAFLGKFWEEFEFVPDMYERIMRYEIGIAEQAREAGLRMKAFVSLAQFKETYLQIKRHDYSDEISPDYVGGGATWYFWYGLIHYHRFPFLRVKIARMKERGLREVIERHAEMPFFVIESHVDRVNGIQWLTERGDPRLNVDPRSM